MFGLSPAISPPACSLVRCSGQAYFDIDYVKVRGSKHPRGEEDAGFIRGWEEGMCQLR